MLLVSISERNTSHTNFSTVENIAQLYRGLCTNLDVQKFINMSNFELFVCGFKLSLEELEKEEFANAELYDPVVENLADSVLQYMRENVDVYYDVLTKIDEYRHQVSKYSVDK